MFFVPTIYLLVLHNIDLCAETPEASLTKKSLPLFVGNRHTTVTGKVKIS